jgi:ATP-dependent Clp protease ATP-binding subunit ClpA
MTTEAPEFDNTYLKNIMEDLYRVSTISGQAEITLDMFVLHLTCHNKEFQDILSAADVDIDELKDYLSDITESISTGKYPTISSELIAFNASVVGAAKTKSKLSITIFDIVEQLITEDCFAMMELETHDFAAKFKKELDKKERDEKAAKMAVKPKSGKTSLPPGMFPGIPGMGGAETVSIETVNDAMEYFLQYGANFSADAIAGKLDPVIGREHEINQVVHALNRRRMKNALLVGPAGVGKTAIAEGIALDIEHKVCSPAIADSIVLSLDIGSLLAGTKYRGEFEERVKKVFSALAIIPNVILFIDEVHQMAGANGGESSPMNFAQMLKPHLSRSGIRCIAATTEEEYRKHMKDAAIRRRFSIVKVEEPNHANTIKILQQAKTQYEDYHHVDISEDALSAAVILTNRYVKTLSQPDKAISLLDSASTHVKLSGERIVNKEVIEKVLSMQLGIPVSTSTATERSVLSTLESNLKAKVFGQDKAAELLSDSVIVARMGMREENLPAGCFMFTGPTGVGKTEMAIQLSKILDRPLIRLDMSEYSEPHTASKLWGSPPGYVGYNDSGKLVNDIREKPTAILLLDEFEKAHSTIQNAFLQVLSAARMTTPQQEVIDFQNCILIFTSNVGGKTSLKNGIGFGASDSYGEEAANAEIEKAWSPEFRNRFDAIIVFNKLDNLAIKNVASAKMKKVAEMANDKGIILVYDDDLIDYIAKNGVDANMGARPIGRYITEHVSKPVSKKMITTEGEAMITIVIVDNKIAVI